MVRAPAVVEPACVDNVADGMIAVRQPRGHVALDYCYHVGGWLAADRGGRLEPACVDNPHSPDGAIICSVDAAIQVT
jgi:hypothetical protein